MKQLVEEVCVICNEKMDRSLYRFENEAVEPFKYVGYEFCITVLIKLENYYKTSRQVRFE